MRRYFPIVWALTLLLSTQPRSTVQGQANIAINILAVDTRQFPEIGIDFQVQDAAGRKVQGLTERNIRVLEDSTRSHAVVSLDSQTADTSNPSRKVKLVAPNPNLEAEVDLFASGAAIGIVFDKTTMLNAPGSDRDYLAEGRRAIEQFLLQPSLAPNNPEIVSLFQPISSPDQQVQPREFEQFTVDRNALINDLRTSPPRTGKTNLYAAVQEAVVDTAAAARSGGREALVLVVGDGGDEISADTFNSIINQANASKVRLVTFGIGTDTALIKQKGGFQLSQLAAATNGAYFQRPDDATAGEAFRQYATITSDTLYTVRYKTALLDDGKQHTFVVQVTTPEGQTTSQQVAFFAKHGEPITLRPLGPVLLRDYFALSIPAALLVSLMIVLLTGGVRWRHSRSISRVQTMR